MIKKTFKCLFTLIMFVGLLGTFLVAYDYLPEDDPSEIEAYPLEMEVFVPENILMGTTNTTDMIERKLTTVTYRKKVLENEDSINYLRISLDKDSQGNVKGLDIEYLSILEKDGNIYAFTAEEEVSFPEDYQIKWGRFEADKEVYSLNLSTGILSFLMVYNPGTFMTILACVLGAFILIFLFIFSCFLTWRQKKD